MPSPDVLQGIRALILRPEKRGRSLLAAINAAGGDAWQFPMLETRSLSLTHQQQAVVHSLDQYHKVICISVTAASSLLEQIDSWWPQLPTGIGWYAIGPATARCLDQAGLQPVQAEEKSADSESLLSHADMQQINGQRILLACGQGGRTHLQEQLGARGAEVQRLELYERYCPSYETGAIDKLVALRQVNCIVATSSEMISNLLHYFNPEQSSDCRLLVPGARVATLAEHAGFNNRNIVVAEGADDASMIRALGKLRSL